MPGDDPALRVEAARVAELSDSQLILALSHSDLLTHRSHCEYELDSAEKVRDRWPALYRSGTPPLRIELAQINAELARRILSETT